MATLNQVYGQKDSGITVKKTHMVPLDKLYIEDGYNIRDIDWEHVQEFTEAYKAGEHVPPLTVEVTERGIKVLDGHHRYLGATEATKQGFEIARLECKDFVGTEADKVALMITSSQGKPLSPIERAKAYERLFNQGWTKEEIAKKVKRSVTDVSNHLDLADCSPKLKEMVKDGSMSYVSAIKLQKEHTVNAEEKAEELKEKAAAKGAKKITPKQIGKQFDAKKAKQLVGLLSNCEERQIDGIGYLMPRFGVIPLVLKLISELNPHKNDSEAGDSENQCDLASEN